jgi:hypothetical protein
MRRFLIDSDTGPAIKEKPEEYEQPPPDDPNDPDIVSRDLQEKIQNDPNVGKSSKPNENVKAAEVPAEVTEAVKSQEKVVHGDGNAGDKTK